jgi:hypothetical protein
LPASSPPPAFESDSDDSEDDYGKQEEEQEKARLKALAKGGRAPPSLEDDDEDDEQEFEAEVAQNGLDEEMTPTKKGKKSRSEPKSKKPAADPKSKRKRKQREVTETSGSAAGPSKSAKGKRKTATAAGTSKPVTSAPHPADSADSADSDSDDGDYAKKPGQISEETRERLFELESQFKGDVAKLARENGKSAKTFFQILGVQQKSTRVTSAWNVFQSWYSQVKGNPGHRKSCTSFWFFQYLTRCFSARGCVLRGREGGFLGGVWTPREMGERHPRHRQHSMARRVAEGRRSTSSHQFPQRK